MNATTIYESVPAVSELNRVPGFDPLRFLRRTDNGPTLDLKVKKLWFRLKYPTGRIKLTALKITDQLAIIEARVYFDKNDTQPASSFTAQRDNKTTPGGLYVEAAQYAATDRALSDAGFGIQLTPVPPVDEAVRTAPAAETKKAVQEVVLVPKKLEQAAPASTVEKTDAPALEKVAPTPVVEKTDASVVKPSAPFVVEEEADLPFTMEPTAVSVEEESAPAAPQQMSVEEAGDIVVPLGTCKGWTLKQVAERRPASLKWYLNAYKGDDANFRAAAEIMHNYVEKKAS